MLAGTEVKAPSRDRSSAVAAPAAKTIPTVGNLTVEVICGRDLPPMDGDTSDPFVKIKYGNQKFRTKTLKKNLQPQWNETFQFVNIPIGAVLELKVMDEDFTSDDQMGQSEIDLRAQQAAAKGLPGKDWMNDTWILINDKYPNAAVRLKFTFKVSLFRVMLSCYFLELMSRKVLGLGRFPICRDFDRQGSREGFQVCL